MATQQRNVALIYGSPLIKVYNTRRSFFEVEGTILAMRQPIAAPKQPLNMQRKIDSVDTTVSVPRNISFHRLQ